MVFQRASNALDCIIYWKRFGANRFRFGSKFGTPKVVLNTNVLYAYFVFNTYFTVLNVLNDCMTHPCKYIEVYIYRVTYLYTGF